MEVAQGSRVFFEVTHVPDPILIMRKVYMTDPLAVHAANLQWPSDYETLIWLMAYWFFVLRFYTMLPVLTECRKMSPIDEADTRTSPSCDFYFSWLKFFIHAKEVTDATCDFIVEYTCLWFFMSQIFTRQSALPAAM